MFLKSPMRTFNVCFSQAGITEHVKVEADEFSWQGEGIIFSKDSDATHFFARVISIMPAAEALAQALTRNGEKDQGNLETAPLSGRADAGALSADALDRWEMMQTRWMEKDTPPKESGYYYVRHEIVGKSGAEISMRYFDASDKSWWHSNRLGMNPNNSFAEWLFIAGVTDRQH